MAWRALIEDDLVVGITGAELAPARSAVLKLGQIDPVPVVIQKVMDLVRGYIAASSAPTLGAEQTIPDKLIDPAANIAVWRIVSRLPVKSLQTDARRDAYKDGLAQLKDVANNKLRFESPLVKTAEKLAIPRPSISSHHAHQRQQITDGGI